MPCITATGLLLRQTGPEVRFYKFHYPEGNGYATSSVLFAVPDARFAETVDLP